MKIATYFRTDKKNKSGEIPVYIIIRDGHARTLINTKLTTTTPFEGTVFPSTEHNYRPKTARLMQLMTELETYAILHPDATPEEVKEAVTGKKSVSASKKLHTYISEFGKTRTAASTRVLYDITARKVQQFDAAATFRSVDADWLRRFEEWCRQTMTINGTAKELRNIRAVYNWALDNEITDRYPFRKFRIRQERTRKRSLTVEQLRQLINYPCGPWQAEYRDIFVLSFFLIGINISDLLELKQLTDGRCVYHRNKTGRLYDIAVPPEALAIIERYRGTDYLLRCLEHTTVNAYTHKLNDALKSIGEQHKEQRTDEDGNPIKRSDGRTMWYIKKTPLFPELSTYWARHTWATIAASLDIPKETISKALGHADEKTADIYIEFDMRKIDEANRKVIDWVLYGRK